MTGAPWPRSRVSRTQKSPRYVCPPFPHLHGPRKRLPCRDADGEQVRFGQVKRKLGITTNTDTPTASRTPVKKGTFAADTPTRVTKSSGRAGSKGRARGKDVKVEGEDDDDETVVGMKNEHLDAELEADVGSFLTEEASFMDDEEPTDPF